MVYESGIESDDDGQDEEEESEEKEDIYGFIKTKSGWFSTVVNADFATHPYLFFFFFKRFSLWP